MVIGNPVTARLVTRDRTDRFGTPGFSGFDVGLGFDQGIGTRHHQIGHMRQP